MTITLLLFIAFFFRLALLNFGTLDLDFNTFIAWSVNLAQNGFRDFYSGWSDYLPGYLYVLWALGKIRGALPDVFLYKLPAILADLSTGYLIYQIVTKLKDKRWGLISSAIYMFNPAVWANSTLWGQVDSLTAFFSLLAVFLLDKYFLLSAIALAVGTLIKPQAAFALPVILFLFVKKKNRIIGLPRSGKLLAAYLMAGLLVFLLGFLPFSRGNFFQFVLERLRTSFSQYPYTSVNAFNFWGIFGFWKSDSFITQITGLLVAFTFSLAAGMKLLNKKAGRYILLSIIFVSTFLFLTRIHERHFLPAIAPLTIAAVIEPVLLVPLIGFSITYLLNLYYSYYWVTYDFKEIFPSGLTTAFSILNLLLFAVLAAGAMNSKYLGTLFIKAKHFFAKKRRSETVLPKINLSAKTTRLLLAVILLFSLGSRLYKLSSPGEMYFDEVYHAFTAKLVLHADPKAWEWDNPHPEGFAYEWTHPPLAKLFMAGGMKFFGENAFGWRFPAAIFGVGIVYLVYLLGKAVFKDEAVGLLSAGIFSLDGLPLVISRIGMNDTYLLFFVLLTIYQFLKGRDFWSAIFLGLALASKWSAVWVVPILFIIWLHRKKKFTKSLIWFLLLPLAIYLLAYFQMFATGHDLNTWWGMQKQMWWYHTGLDATHSYGSMALSWPLMLRPVYLYTSEEIGGWVSRIYAIGNPFVFWFGLISIILSVTIAFAERNKKLGLVVFSYLVFFVPWISSPRIMFLYHYLPSLPFLAIASAYILRRFPRLIFPLLAISFSLFTYFYPHWAGLKVPLWLDASYYWFPTWR